ncbi:nuclear transport factor 2 family protein [Nocardia sp. NPDC058633]|uniref:nuclear transport factor 2 family protein n=1 Tax=Nocardia sp. NPDC058633 TaxID=3346568 RepID=UPI00364707C6
MPKSAVAVQTALHYFTALSAGNLSKAMRYIAEDVVCDTPSRSLHGSKAYRQFISQCLPAIRGATLVASFGDDTTAVLIYDLTSPPRVRCRGADRLVVDNNRIVNIVTVVEKVPD